MHIRGTLLRISAPICVPSVGWAQDARPVAGFQNGFFVNSIDGENRLVFGVVAQVDERFSVDHPLDPPTRQWGALQVVGRYAELTVDRAVFDRGLAAAGANRRARQYTAGGNGYPAAVMKYDTNFEHTSFLAGLGTRPAEDVVVLRAHEVF